MRAHRQKGYVHSYHTPDGFTRLALYAFVDHAAAEAAKAAAAAAAPPPPPPPAPRGRVLRSVAALRDLNPFADSSPNSNPNPNSNPSPTLSPTLTPTTDGAEG